VIGEKTTLGGVEIYVVKTLVEHIHLHGISALLLLMYVVSEQAGAIRAYVPTTNLAAAAAK
jgi:hypothetical protein